MYKENYKTFKEEVLAIYMPLNGKVANDELTGEELQQIENLIKIYTNQAIDNMQREIFPLKKTVKLSGKTEKAPEDMIKFLGCEEKENAELSYDEEGNVIFVFQNEGEHTVRYTYDSGSITGDNYIFPFSRECLTAMKYFVLYNLFALDNDTRQYSAYYNLYNQQCTNIISSLQNPVTIKGGMNYV